jgi:hypothetical protein
MLSAVDNVCCCTAAREFLTPKYFLDDLLKMTTPGALYRDSWPSLFIGQYASPKLLLKLDNTRYQDRKKLFSVEIVKTNFSFFQNVADSVVDGHRFDADGDPNFHFDVDPDSDPDPDVDPDVDPDPTVIHKLENPIFCLLSCRGISSLF